MLVFIIATITYWYSAVETKSFVNLQFLMVGQPQFECRHEVKFVQDIRTKYWVYDLNGVVPRILRSLWQTSPHAMSAAATSLENMESPYSFFLLLRITNSAVHRTEIEKRTQDERFWFELYSHQASSANDERFIGCHYYMIQRPVS